MPRNTATAAVLLAGALLAVPGVAHATFVDFWGGGANGQLLGSDASFAGGVLRARAGGTGSVLTRVDQGAGQPIRGLGVCGGNEDCFVTDVARFPYDLPSAWDGTVSEMDDTGKNGNITPESIRLFFVGAAPDGRFRLGSLTGAEAGTVKWSNATGTHFVGYNAAGATENGAVLTHDGDGLFTLDLSAALGWAGGAACQAGAPGGCTSEIRFSGGGTFSAKGGVGVVPGDAFGNAHLLASAGVVGATPVPAALPLFLSALTGLGLIRRRSAS